MPRIVAIWKQVRDSLWFLPAVITLTGGVAALLLIQVDRGADGLSPDDLWWLYAGGADGARGVLGAIAGGIITVTGVVFSVTIVALQLASTQFTPRVLRQFMADRANQIVLGVFIATFTFTLLVQRTVRSGDDAGGEFVPALAVTAALVLALVAIGFLIFFIHHVARSIQVETIISRVSADTLAALDACAGEVAAEETPPLPPGSQSRPLCSRRAGYLQAIDDRALFEQAVEHDLLLRVHVPIGAFLVPDQVIASIWCHGGDHQPDEKLHDAFVLGPSRTPHQDIGFGIIELVDIAVKALSPGINDPTTAMTAIDALGHVVLEVGRGPSGQVRLDAENGRVRVVRPRIDLDRAVRLGWDQIRLFGASNPAVAMRTATALRTVATLLPVGRRAPVCDQLRLLRADVEREVHNPADRARALAEIEDALAAAAA